MEGGDFKAPTLGPVQKTEGAQTTATATAQTAEMEIMYKKPEWSSVNKTDVRYWIEVIKDGLVVETIPLEDKEFYLFGRHPVCDVVMENPTVSRQHCAFQMHTEGCLFLFDMGSAHGTLINKRPAKSNQFVLLRPGDVLRLAQSTRLLVINSNLSPEDFDDRFQLRKTSPSSSSSSDPEAVRMQESDGPVNVDQDGQVFEGNMAEVEQFLKSRGLKQESKNTGKFGQSSYLNGDDSRPSRPPPDAFAVDLDEKIVKKGQKKVGKKGGKKQSDEEEDEEDEEAPEFFDDLGGNRVEGYDFFLGRDSYENQEDDEFYDRTKESGDGSGSGGKKSLWKKPLLTKKKAPSKTNVETSASVRSKLMILIPQIHDLSRKIQQSSSSSSSSASVASSDDSLDAFFGSVAQSLDVCLFFFLFSSSSSLI